MQLTMLFHVPVQLSLLSAEEMAGDNQYFCDFCHAKRDAQRQMSLRTAPPYLCLSLQRFVFDMKVWTRHHLLCVFAMLAVKRLACVMQCACAQCYHSDAISILLVACQFVCSPHCAMHTPHPSTNGRYECASCSSAVATLSADV